MELFEAILQRRTIKDFTTAPVPDDLLDRVLTAGLWAQNHHLTQPWRFIVLGPKTQQAWAEVFAAAQVQGLPPTADDATRAKVRAGAMQKMLTKPRIVVVSYCLNGDAFARREDYAATCCAIQNIHLAAHAEGLGMQWGTSAATTLPQTYDLLGIDPAAEEIAGFLYFGYPALVPPAAPRKPLAEVTRRMP